jgi:hypothetical protein
MAEDVKTDPADALAALDAAWAEKGDWIEPEQSLELFMNAKDAQGFELWGHQEEALMDLALGNHVILGTPTGSGKSLVAEGFAFMALGAGYKFYYTAPIKALVSEKFFWFVDVFGRENVGMATGDASINPDAPIICCTAEILAQTALREGNDTDIACVAMDEFHYYGDADRGWAWQVPLLVLPDTQFLLMSATLGDVSRIASDLEQHTNRPVDCILDAPRPVPLSYQYAKNSIENTVAGALSAGEGPIYAVHFSQDAALNSAGSLASFGVSDKEQRNAIKDMMKGTRFSTPFGKTLQRLLLAGVGVHHAGMLPRYRLLVERLAQEGLLPVICGTDTLGVGINVPIHTVLITSLSKFDGKKVRRLKSREFHQIAGRAGRSGFDTEGCVIVQAPEYEIENEKARAKAADDPKKLKKLKLKRAPEGFVGWNESTFQKLVETPPETLVPHMKITNAMVLNVVSRGGDALATLDDLIEKSAVSDERKTQLRQDAREIMAILIDTGVVVMETVDGAPDYHVTVELPRDFAMDQPLSPFLIASLELLDPESPDYALDVVSLAEATLENPRQILNAQERKARDAAWAALRAEGVDVEERKERVAEVTYEKPLEDLLDAAFEKYCVEVPWARDYTVEPKSVVRDMVETSSSFKSYIGRYGIARQEGLLLRYLSDAFNVLDRTIPPDKRDERLDDIIAWLGYVVRTTDSSLIDAWAGLESAEEDDLAAPGVEAVVADPHGLKVQIKNALVRVMRSLAEQDADALGDATMEGGFGVRAWRDAIDAYYGAHEEVLLDADARSWSYIDVDTSNENVNHTWSVRQRVKDDAGDFDFMLVGTVDLDATQESGEIVWKKFAAGLYEDLEEADALH